MKDNYKIKSYAVDESNIEKIESYKKSKKLSSNSSALNEIISLHSNTDKPKQFNTEEHELYNILQISSFLQIKSWESRENDGLVHMKNEDIEKLIRFVSSCNDLIHNASFMRETLNNEGYTNFVKVIEKSREYL